MKGLTSPEKTPTGLKTPPHVRVGKALQDYKNRRFQALHQVLSCQDQMRKCSTNRPKMYPKNPNMEAKKAPRGFQNSLPPRFWRVLAAKRPQEAPTTPSRAPYGRLLGASWGLWAASWGTLCGYVGPSHQSESRRAVKVAKDPFEATLRKWLPRSHFGAPTASLTVKTR